jgi:hypothetical protein
LRKSSKTRMRAAGADPACLARVAARTHRGTPHGCDPPQVRAAG